MRRSIKSIRDEYKRSRQLSRIRDFARRKISEMGKEQALRVLNSQDWETRRMLEGEARQFGFTLDEFREFVNSIIQEM